MARLQEWTLEVVNELRYKMDEYTQDNALPRLADFCYKNDISREYLYKIIHNVLTDNYCDNSPEFKAAISELSYSLKKLLLKKEDAIEMGGLLNKFNSGIAAFSLKQLGWRDKFEHENINLNTDSPETFKKMVKEIEGIFE